jgi:hypothetical protein
VLAAEFLLHGGEVVLVTVTVHHDNGGIKSGVEAMLSAQWRGPTHIDVVAHGGSVKKDSRGWESGRSKERQDNEV